MSVLSRYLCSRYALHVSIVLIALSSLALAFDLMETTDNILNQPGGNVLAVLRYSALRLPDIIAQMLPFSALLAALLTLGMVMRHSELVAMWGGGISNFSVLRKFLPVALGLTAVQFALDDRAVPAVMTELYTWSVGDFRRGGLFSQEENAVWLMSGMDIIRTSVEAARVGRVEGITIFRRDPAGVLYAALDARRAEPTREGWRLTDVIDYRTKPLSAASYPEVIWDGTIELRALSLLSGGLRDLTLNDMNEIIGNRAFGQRPIYVAETWVAYRIAASLTPALMLCLVVAYAQSFQRGGGFARLLGVSLIVGFAYLVLDNISLALGESGFLTPWFAGWAPKLALMCLIAFLLVRHEN